MRTLDEIALKIVLFLIKASLITAAIICLVLVPLLWGNL